MFESRKLIKKTPVAEMDSIKSRQKVIGKKKDLQLLNKCEQLWMNMDEFREEGARALRFAYGDQWGDYIEVDGVKMTQRQYLMQTGNVVIQTNQIKNKIDTIVGVMVKEKNEPICNARDRDEQQYGELMTTALQANCNKNKMEALYIKWLKDLCIRGLAVSQERYEYRNSRLDTWTDYVEPNCLFMDSEMTDPRFWDINIIGQFFDLSFGSLVARFAQGEDGQQKYDMLKEVYHSQSSLFLSSAIQEFTDHVDNTTMVFRTPQDLSRCRVFEVWTKETAPRIRLHDENEGTEEVIEASDRQAISEVDAENRQRKALGKQQGWSDDEIPLIKKEFFIDEFWYCRFLAPDGTIIWEGESPYADRMHPFSICATPFVGGKIKGYMHDAIDHNMAMNRVLILQDWLARTQAKGVTVVPKKIVPEGDYKKFARSWTAIDDIVFIEMDEASKDLMPKVFYGNAQTYNASELINIYSKLMENSTAVSGALQGKTPYSGTSGALYAQMSANSSTPIAALLTQFHTFLEELHIKKMKNIIMFYDVTRFKQIAGNIDGILDNPNLSLSNVADIEYDLSIQESTQSPVHRAIINDDAKEFVLKGLITFEEYLTIASVPYADKLLQMRQARQVEAQNAQEQSIMPADTTMPQQPQPGEPTDADGNRIPYLRTYDTN